MSDHVAHEMLEFDGKLPRTLRVLLTQPGQLALDYVAGRRKPYVSPLRLYLLIFLVHLFLMSFLAPHPMTMPEFVRLYDPTGALTRLMASRGAVDWSVSQPDEHLLERLHWVSQALTLLVFLGVAGIQALLLMRLHRRYLEHLSLALNVSAFYLLLCVAGDIVASVVSHQHMQQMSYQIASLMAETALPLYWCLSARRFYRVGWPAAIAVAVLLTLGMGLLAQALEAGLLAVIIETT